MFNIHLPTSIYERLPQIYLVLAAILAVTPLPPVKWVSVAALVTATALTWLLRWVNRQVEQE
ncbi:MAG: hypothetical protein GY856_09500 [bacterium]|nr:hypothetical protein [bacterium]